LWLGGRDGRGCVTLNGVKTNAVRLLDRLGVRYELREYEVDPEALDELKSSIQQQGIIQPVTVRKTADGMYELISGERRVRASPELGLFSIPAYIIEVHSDQEMLELALVENLQRRLTVGVSAVDEDQLSRLLRNIESQTGRDVGQCECETERLSTGGVESARILGRERNGEQFALKSKLGRICFGRVKAIAIAVV